MTELSDDGFEEILSSIVGPRATYQAYDRTQETPMNFVLDEVEKDGGRPFSVLWVNGGGPEVFCLPGFSPSPVVFNSNYLVMAGIIRFMFVAPYIKGQMLDATAEQVSLKLIAEMALRYGESDLGVLALARYLTGHGIHLSDDGYLRALDDAVIDEVYMAQWFYGLLHEIGHLHSLQAQPFPDNHVLSNAGIVNAVSQALDGLPGLPTYLKDIIKLKSSEPSSDFILSVDNLRAEAIADMFAAHKLLYVTVDIMQKIDAGPFNAATFVRELAIFFNVIWIIDLCRRVARTVKPTIYAPDPSTDNLLYLVSVHVRNSIQMGFVCKALAIYLFGHEPTPQQTAEVESMVTDVNGRIAAVSEKIETGVAKTIDFLVELNEMGALEVMNRLSSVISNPVCAVEARRFCDAADILQRDGELLCMLKSQLQMSHS